LAKVTKTVSSEMLLCRTGLSAQNRKNSGLRPFAGLPYRFITLYAKSRYALCHFTGQLFFRISPEAVLLTRGGVGIMIVIG